MSAPDGARVLRLDELPLQPTVAHGGVGRIGFHPVFDAADFRGP